MDARRILVSGTSGPIGAALLPALVAQGYSMTRLVRGKVRGGDEIAWDPEQPLPPQAVSGFHGVIHLAGESIAGRWTAAKKRRILDSRVHGTRHLAGATAKAPQRPAVFITASAIGFYGNRGDEVLREDSPSGEGFLPGVVRAWEEAARPALEAGIRMAHTRFGLVLSAAGGALPRMLLPFRLGVGGKVGSGRQWWSWVHIQDVVGGILHVLDSDLKGPVNVAAPNPARNEDFTRALGRVLSRPTVFPLPAFAARLVFGQMGDELLLASQRVQPAKLVASGYGFQYSELEPALREILRR